MDALLQRHCAKLIYVVPEGLRELMSDISREVLRSQPEQLCTFVADYLDALLITRENARVAARLLQVITEIGTTIVEFLTRTGLSRAEADRITTIIQNAFRKHVAKKIKEKKLEHETDEEEQVFVERVMEEADIRDEILETAAKIIQRAYRSYKERERMEKHLLYGMVDWRVAARSTIALYRRTGVTYAEANRAATLIKAAYKGYYTRRVMRRLLEMGIKEYEESLVSEEESEYYAGPYPKLEVRGEDVDDDDYWCYCFVDKKESSGILTPVCTEETVTHESQLSSEAVAQDVMESLIHHIIPSDMTMAAGEELTDAGEVVPPPDVAEPGVEHAPGEATEGDAGHPPTEEHPAEEGEKHAEPEHAGEPAAETVGEPPAEHAEEHTAEHAAEPAAEPAAPEPAAPEPAAPEPEAAPAEAPAEPEPEAPAAEPEA